MDSEVKALSAEEQEYLKLRLRLFTEIILLAVTTMDEENLSEINSNACSIIIFILTKETIERQYFVSVYEDNNDIIVRKFLSSLNKKVNNKLGNVFLAYLEEAFKQSNIENPEFKISSDKIESYFKNYLDKLVSYLNESP